MTRRRAGPLHVIRIGHALSCVVELEASGKCRLIGEVMVKLNERVVLDCIQGRGKIELGRISVYSSIRQWEKGQVRLDRRVNWNCSCRRALGIATEDPLACIQ